MTIVTKFMIFQAALIIPFAAGYAGTKYFSRIGRYTKRLIRFNLIAIEPLIVFWSVWGLVLHGGLLLLPVSGLFLVLLGLALGYAAARPLGLSGTARPTFIISSSLANHGFTMGGFICYLFLGETGLGYSFIFISYFMPFIFLYIFPYARAASGVPMTWRSVLFEYVLNLQNMPLVALVAALGMHLFGIPRSDAAFPVDILLLLSIAVYYFSLGINFSAADVRALRREGITLAAVKFAAVPGITILLLAFIPAGAEVKAVIVLQSFMPAAIYSVVSAVLFNLDTKMASGLFVVNTVIFLVVVLPVLILIKKLLPGL